MAYEVLEDEPAGRYEVLPAETTGTGNAAVDAGNAAGTGFWRGAVRLAGLPVDTVANVPGLGPCCHWRSSHSSYWADSGLADSA